MSHRFRLCLRPVPFLIFALFFAITNSGAGEKEKQLKKFQWSHAFNLGCRKYGEEKFDEKTKKWGLEAFRDNNTGAGGIGFYISQVGCIALAPNFADLDLTDKERKSKPPEHKTGLDVPARKAGVLPWKGAKIHSMEIFRDPNADNWLYITDQGNIAACDAKGKQGTGGSAPKWIHSVDLQVRKGGVKEWTNAAKFGIEVYRDGNTGNLLYITENGAIAALPETKEVVIEKDKAGKPPEWLHGLDLQCRKFDEKKFS